MNTHTNKSLASCCTNMVVMMTPYNMRIFGFSQSQTPRYDVIFYSLSQYWFARNHCPTILILCTWAVIHNFCYKVDKIKKTLVFTLAQRYLLIVKR